MTVLERTLDVLARLNAEDPTSVGVGRNRLPRALAQAERLSAWIKKLEPEPSSALRIAAYCQHLLRWQVQRDEFPPGRTGYLAWRKAAARHSADKAEQVLRDAEYDAEIIQGVRRIVLKQGIKQHADVQAMEDALCLSFLEFEYADFIAAHDDDKVLHILASTWNKMSPRGHELALELVPMLEGRARQLLERATGSPQG